MTTIEEFVNMDQLDKDWILWSQGVEIGHRTDSSYRYLLYQVDGFYVEIQYTIRYDAARRFICFDELYLLDPYLEQIDISELI